MKQSDMNARLTNAIAFLKADGKPHSIAAAAVYLREQEHQES